MQYLETTVRRIGHGRQKHYILDKVCGQTDCRQKTGFLSETRFPYWSRARHPRSTAPSSRSRRATILPRTFLVSSSVNVRSGA